MGDVNNDDLGLFWSDLSTRHPKEFCLMRAFTLEFSQSSKSKLSQYMDL